MHSLRRRSNNVVGMYLRLNTIHNPDPNPDVLGNVSEEKHNDTFVWNISPVIVSIEAEPILKHGVLHLNVSGDQPGPSECSQNDLSRIPAAQAHQKYRRMFRRP